MGSGEKGVGAGKQLLGRESYLIQSYATGEGLGSDISEESETLSELVQTNHPVTRMEQKAIESGTFGSRTR
ncbi:hypothetical protein RISK_006590 [Rhodopirellula islandica]|uniref:Uncharacterized protein n=1 Tax=Rhodopirellula islandica TaxID=595434 RepID=A0A0J1E7J3_RHOIS|nr:hypothetical protein RISK_006590 [Rhodopirellula islandica]